MKNFNKFWETSNTVNVYGVLIIFISYIAFCKTKAECLFVSNII